MTEKYRKWWGLFALIPAVAMVFVDQSVLPVALPTIQSHLGASDIALQWCVNSYLLVMATLVLIGGKIGDLLGHRRSYCLGILLFALASALCGMSTSVSWLIGARALQGVGAALIFPSSSAIMMTLFSNQERGKAIGINVSVSSLFLVLGPLIGGYLTEALSWRWIFWINLPLMVLGILLVLLFIPKIAGRKERLDLFGFSLFACGCALFITALMQGGVWGWASWKTLLFFLVGIASFLFLLWREKEKKSFFFDLSLYRHPVYSAANISIFATQFILMITVYRAIFFQDVLHWSPFEAGWVTVMSSYPVLFMSMVGGWLSDRFGPKLPIALGFGLLTYSFFWLAFFVQGPFWMLLLGLTAFGFGIPLIFTPSYASAMNAVPLQKAGSAFGILATVRAISSTLSVAVIASFTAGVETLSLQRQASEEEAGLAAFFYSHLMMGILLIIAFVFVFFLHHKKSAHHLPEAPAEGWD